ncbi:MAG TPA: aminoacyl--tRNA ligase-related protein [Solirubrobacterales bacterium]|nr:aminoacyl--tRNA ligase-related protein [Solirubrobacterales bacterium]
MHRKVEAILREEMEGIGCQEMLMPVLQPSEAWEKTGRYSIDELFKLEDRKGAPMVLAMTHEECVTQHVAREVRSYRDLPLMLFHIQTKERDEPRPRAGVLRTREFTMKDAYSFDRDEEGLARSYEAQSGAYERIFDRSGLRWYRVESDVGMMGGSGAHEYMAPCAAGENEVALAPGYAANVEIASAEAQAVELPPLGAPEEVDTPGLTKVEEVAGHLGLPHGAFIKTLPIVVEGRGMVLVLLRGDHRQRLDQGARWQAQVRRHLVDRG